MAGIVEGDSPQLAEAADKAPDYLITEEKPFGLEITFKAERLFGAKNRGYPPSIFVLFHLVA